jgi:uncharacterized membrane protein YoaK (UPF0700 family)
MTDTTPLRDPLASLVGACLLAGTGGMLDVIVFLNQNHVFACAMTGNVIFMAVAAVGRDWVQVGRHGVLLVAFFLGIAGSMFLRTRRAAVFGIALQIVALVGLGFVPRGVSPVMVTVVIAFSASLQVATFRKVDGMAYNSAFVTGNLRSVAEAAYLLLFPREHAAIAEVEKTDPEEQQRAVARGLTLVCGAFLVGALLGAWLAPRLGNRSLWVVAVPLVVTLGIAWRHRRAMEAANAEG